MPHLMLGPQQWTHMRFGQKLTCEREKCIGPALSEYFGRRQPGPTQHSSVHAPDDFISIRGDKPDGREIVELLRSYR